MKLFFRGFIIFFLFIFLALFFAPSSFAATTPFRSANIIATDGTVSYTNLNNCSVTDGQTCDRAMVLSYANLYFRDFGNYNDFGIPQGSAITKVRIRVTGKTSPSLYVGLSSGTTFQANCQWPSDLWILWQLNGQVINTQIFITSVVDQFQPGTVSSYCLDSYNFENKNFIFRINYSSGQPWSANIDNFEIAFDYDPPVILTPTPTPTPTPRTPLILIPGIGGSELKTTQSTVWLALDGHGGTFTHVYPAEEKVWVNSLEAIKPGEDDYFDVLRMHNDGTTSEANINLTGSLAPEAYQPMIDYFIESGYALGQDLFVFPYDWRKDIVSTAPLLDQKINEIKTQTGSTKVDIISHSMGGLVARNYISDSNRALNVRKLFTLGTPHLGSVDFLKNLMFGGCLTKAELQNLPYCLGVTSSEVKDVIQNMISGFELAPSQSYFNFYSGEDNQHPFPYRIESGSLNYSQIKNLLTGLNYNTPLFIPSENFHTLDDSLSNTNNVDVTIIAGSGIQTLGQIIELNIFNLSGNKITYRDQININGDGTVPLLSASINDSHKGLFLNGLAKVYYVNQEHGGLVTEGSSLNLVKNILANDSNLPAGVSETPYKMTGHALSVHSPVNIHVYDQDNNHTGPNPDGDFEASIPGSSYDTLDDAKFIWLPDDGQYTIKMDAINQGSFDFKIRKYENDNNTETVLYNDIPLTENTKAETTFNTLGEPPILLIDEEGDGITDLEVAPDSVLTGDVVLDQTSPQTTVELSGIVGLNGWHKSNVIVTLDSKDEASGSGILKTEYSLDNGVTVNTYVEPFTISAEKINKLKFRSIDKAGNEEEPKEMEIKIDKTAPEAKIFVDTDKQDLIVTGIDANPTAVARTDNASTRKKDDAFYLITDTAGNSLRIDVRERNRDKKDKFRIYSIQYNKDPIKTLASNYFNVSYSGKKTRANVKEQNFELKGEVKIRIKYNFKKNESTIIVKELKKEKVKEIRSGLVYLNLLTYRGQLKTSY